MISWRHSSEGFSSASLEGGDKLLGDAIKELMSQVDSYIPPADHPEIIFLMPIEDVFSISGRGTVVTGQIEAGVVNVGEEIEIVGLKETTITCGVEMFLICLGGWLVITWVFCWVRNVRRLSEVKFWLPGSITPRSLNVSAYAAKEGGAMRFSSYRPQFYFRTTDVTGSVEVPDGTEMVMPGDNIAMTVTLIAPIAVDALYS